MNVIREYTIDQIRKNHRTSLSIMTAILIAATFLCALFTFAQSYWKQAVQQEIYTSGDWDAQLLEVHAGQVAMIQDHGGVKKAFVKGNNQTALISDDTTLPYLLIQNCDADYWDAMREKNWILRGRIPHESGEIVVGKTFFEQNPTYQIGDTLSLAFGERKNHDEIMDFLSPFQNGENFKKSYAASLTIVGEIDVTATSAYNGYPVYGWLDMENLPDDTDMVVYLQMEQPSKVFDVVPQIAQAIGLSMDEYGDHPYRYHTALLGMYGIYAPGKFLSSDLPYLFLLLLSVMAASVVVFAYIISGAFSISSKQKIKQLGILKSVGATPGQIWQTIIYEACLLSVIPIMLSVGLGYLFSYGVLSAYSVLTSQVTGGKMTVSFSPLVACLTVALSFLTVLLAAAKPARQMSKLLPIEAMRENQEGMTVKKPKNSFILKTCFGFLGELSVNSISANKRLFRTCTATLSLCMLLMFGFLAMFAISDINNTKAEQDNHFNVNITLESGQQIDNMLMDDLKDLPHMKTQVTYAMANCAIWLSESELSADFLSMGGFETKAARDYVIRRDRQYRVPCVLIGLDSEAYQNYLTAVGMKVPETASAIVVNSVVKNPDARGYKGKKETISYLNLTDRKSLELTEKFLDSIQGDYTFELDLSAILPSMPDIGKNMAFYTIPIMVPMEKYYDIVQNFQEDRAIYHYRTYMNLLTDDDMDAQIQQDANQICGAYLSNNDFYTSSKTERAADREQLTAATMLLVYSLTALFGVVGISSAASAIWNSLYQRRREFATLRSVGVDEKGIRRLLRIEGFLLAIKSNFIGILMFLVICAVLLWEQDVTLSEFLSVFPSWGFLAYILLVMLVVSGIYRSVFRKIERDVIMEALKTL